MLTPSMTLAELEHGNIHWMSERTAKEVVARFAASGRSVLGIDGFMGSGKSPLSLMLEFQLGVECLHVDDYLPPASPEHEQRRFIDVLDLPRLRRAIDVHRGRGALLIEGILLRDVLSLLLQEEPVFHVYVAAAWRPSPGEMRWNEGDRLALGAFNNALDGQIVEYHCRLLPQHDYDFAVLRDRDDFGHNGIFLAPDGQKFHIPPSVLRASRFHQRKRRSSAFLCCATDAVLEPLGLVTPPLLSPTTRSLNDDRLSSVLTAIVDNAPLPAVAVIQKTGNPRRLVLLDGAHRYFASVAAGFTRLPALHVSGEDAELLYRYSPKNWDSAA